MFNIEQHRNFITEQGDTHKPLRSFCIHAHFYQPPREDPLTGMIPAEIGAAPFRNWNERIHAECYRPNAELGNFERISFNVGPTLFKWMQIHDPITYQRILAQDHSNVTRFGVGNAMAQAYHHTILPLARRADKETQVAWGIADFEHRFRRRPQGMWLPETAVDTETLEVLAENGIEFTILAPWQADSDDLDPTQPYWVKLPSGQRMAVFFYHGGLSAGVSFDQRMTANAHQFALNDVLQHYNSNGRSGEPQILMVASDGELYGHHQAFRDWFLAYLVNGAGAKAGIRLTYPALWLQEHPPTMEMRIRERTSWSCHHGVRRWADDCGCLLEPGDWKRALRLALDWLADQIDHIFVDAMMAFGIDAWKLRNGYMRVLLGEIDLDELVARATVAAPPCPDHRLLVAERRRVDLLLRAQYERQRMYTSCGFFFEDFERIEPKNNLTYATHAIRLTEQAIGVDLSAAFRSGLMWVCSSRTGLRGDQFFDTLAKRVWI